MTQTDIVNGVNHLLVGYTVTWQDIRDDADKAIMKINEYLGTRFPLMSAVMIGTQTPYMVHCGDNYIAIFPETYIKTVVIPFIATEILARDEEFTTIYNKYAQDVDNGLFNMFSNEYNRINPLFLQDETTGVIFGDYNPEAGCRNRIKSPMPLFTVTYHGVAPGIILTKQHYKYNEQWVPFDGNTIGNYFNTEGTKYYAFGGWYKEPTCVTPETGGTICGDVNVFAKFTPTDTMTLGQASSGRLYPKFKMFNQTDPITQDIAKMESISFPEQIANRTVGCIVPETFNISGLNLKRIVIPSTVEAINGNINWNLSLDAETPCKFEFDNGRPIDFDEDSLHGVIANRNITSIDFRDRIASLGATAFGTVVDAEDVTSTDIYHIDLYADCYRATRPSGLNLTDGPFFIHITGSGATETLAHLEFHYKGE